MSEGLYSDAPAADGSRGGGYGIGAREPQAASLALDGEVGVGVAPSRYNVARGGWEMVDLGGGGREGSIDLGERGVRK